MIKNICFLILLATTAFGMDSEFSDNESEKTKAVSIQLTNDQEENIEKYTQLLEPEKRKKVQGEMREYFSRGFEVLELEGIGLTVDDLESSIFPFVKKYSIENINLNKNAFLFNKNVLFPTCIDNVFLRENNIQSIHLIFLTKNNYIKYLDISGNPIGDLGIDILNKFKELRYLEARLCQFTDKGIFSLQQNKLKKIGLSDDGLTEKSFYYLLDSMKLKTLVFNKLNIKQLDLEKIKKNTSIKEITLDTLTIKLKG